MNAFWSYFWPACGVGLVVGIIAGAFAFRAPRIPTKDRETREPIARQKWRRRRMLALVVGIIATIAAAALWHGPFGGAARFTAEVEQSARQVLADNEAPAGVAAHIHHGPLTRRLVLSGPSNDFQQAEAARVLGEIPGVSRAQWSPSGGGTPLILEGTAVAIVGFLLGLVLAYLVELRRRYNAQWNW